MSNSFSLADVIPRPKLLRAYQLMKAQASAGPLAPENAQEAYDAFLADMAAQVVTADVLETIKAKSGRTWSAREVVRHLMLAYIVARMTGSLLQGVSEGNLPATQPQSAMVH